MLLPQAFRIIVVQTQTMLKLTLFLSILLMAAGTVHSQTVKAPMQVIVTNKAGTPIPKDKITFMGKKLGTNIVGITDELGKFIVHLPAGDEYAIKVETIGEEIDYNTFEVPTPPTGAVFQTVTLEIIYDLPTSVVLEDLYFNSGQYSIQQKSFESLNKLAEYLIRKGNMTIRIEGYTDSDGNEASNKTLSANRSKAVKSYLVKKGVKADSIRTIGHGDSNPIATNDTVEGKAQNRRTEIHITH
ncbi:MAG: outer membrane protein OmpA-like peptidoglycan-associated protein [Flavobacteriaceae bacterium]